MNGFHVEIITRKIMFLVNQLNCTNFTEKMTSYEICTFCKKKFLSKNILRHEDNCEYQLKVLIGPELEWVKCNICSEEMYKLPIPTYEHHHNELHIRNNVGIEAHHKRRHKDEEISYTTVNKREQRQEVIIENEIENDVLSLYDKYRITNNGIIYNSLGKIVKKTGKTYESVQLFLDGKSRSFPTDHLVAITFLDKPEKGTYMIHHKDGDIFNNHKDNLEYVKWNEHDAHNSENCWSRYGDFHRKKYTFSKIIEID